MCSWMPAVRRVVVRPFAHLSPRSSVGVEEEAVRCDPVEVMKDGAAPLSRLKRKMVLRFLSR
jgi:hypothetical protein